MGNSGQEADSQHQLLLGFAFLPVKLPFEKIVQKINGENDCVRCLRAFERTYLPKFRYIAISDG